MKCQLRFMVSTTSILMLSISITFMLSSCKNEIPVESEVSSNPVFGQKLSKSNQPIQLPIPTNIVAVVNAQSVTVNWNAVANADGYHVVFSEGINSENNTSALSVNRTGIVPGQYYVKIKARGSGNYKDSDFSAKDYGFIIKATPPFVCGDEIQYGVETYKTVQIGNQCWFQKNLNIGTRINGNTEQTNNGIIEKYCYGDNDANCTTYGGLYQWAEAVQYQNGATNTTFPSPDFSGNVQGICPTGWHIPSKTEMQTLALSVNGAGYALQEIGGPSNGGFGTNTSGFSALFAGFWSGGPFSEHQYAYNQFLTGFWCSTYYSVNPGAASCVYLTNYSNEIGFWYNPEQSGFSVRCLKD